MGEGLITRPLGFGVHLFEDGCYETERPEFRGLGLGV